MSIPANIKQVRIKSFKYDTNENLTYGDIIYFQGKGAVTDIKGSDNQDGTQNLLYEVKVSLSDIKKAKDEVTEPISIIDEKRRKDKSPSKSLRNFAFRVAEETGESAEGLYKLAIEEGWRYLEDKLDQIKDERIA